MFAVGASVSRVFKKSSPNGKVSPCLHWVGRHWRRLSRSRVSPRSFVSVADHRVPGQARLRRSRLPRGPHRSVLHRRHSTVGPLSLCTSARLHLRKSLCFLLLLGRRTERILERETRVAFTNAFECVGRSGTRALSGSNARRICVCVCRAAYPGLR